MNIKNRFTGEIIYRSKKRILRTVVEEAVKSGASLAGANLSRASLDGANLDGASLYRASLYRANLDGANLSGASLYRASLDGANLSGASLDGASLLPNLYILKFQPPKTILRAWKYIQNGKSPYQNAVYQVGKVYIEKRCSTDERIACDKGLNVATLQWCLNDGNDNAEFLEVEFYAEDIIAIPFATDGKFRVRRFKVLRKINRNKAEAIVAKFLKPYWGKRNDFFKKERRITEDDPRFR